MHLNVLLIHVLCACSVLLLLLLLLLHCHKWSAFRCCRILLTHNMRQIDLYANCIQTHALFDSFTHATFSPFFFADDDTSLLLPNTCTLHTLTLTHKTDSEKTTYRSIPLKMHNQKRRDQIVHATILSFIFYDFSLFRIELLPNNKWISFFSVSFQLWVLKFFVQANVSTRVYWLYTIGLNGGMLSNGIVAIYAHCKRHSNRSSSSSSNYYRVVAYHCCIAVQTQKN